jgi:hypothetical protein|tara:strand:- start:14170 stop:14304 length:135 start_codon:yes stop_codon:yes gene_type:complete
MNKTKFNRGITLGEAIQELEYNGSTEITRVMNQDGVFTFEYNTK